jgi:hypothetical protein
MTNLVYLPDQQCPKFPWQQARRLQYYDVCKYILKIDIYFNLNITHYIENCIGGVMVNN